MRSLLTLLFNFLVKTLGIEYYQPMYLNSSWMTNTITTTVSSLSLCTAMCSLQQDDCWAVTYNLTNNNDCTMSYFGLIGMCFGSFPLGDVLYHVSLDYSDDFCFVKIRKNSGNRMRTTQRGWPAFCALLGGKLPEIKKATELTSLQTLGMTPTMYMGLTLDSSNQTWRWMSDNSDSGFNLTNTNATVGNRCGYFSVAAPPSYAVANACNICVDQVCQLC